ncbi:MAG TPA: PIG-L family deacetylase, partial [Candidatus Eisenbacteria bacterium]|nr:PIG-L family deacetylase [Candidatus Eisenbacteria bacterium]
ITWLSRERRARVGYLSMTRGSGGQNLIGPETGEALGVIRTQELLSARRVDGAEQFFTRAIDFGYSKTAEETMRMWGHDRILSDVVRAIREFRPDVIITRFPTDGRGGHGHHQASAILAQEAFTAAADSARFPEQGLRPWQAKRLLWNAFQLDSAAVASGAVKPLTVDLGAYSPLLGESYTEIAARSRSMHKSQGFGAPERRGPIPNHLVLQAGEPARADLFEGVTTTWQRIRGGKKVDEALAVAARDFDPAAPHKALPALARAHAAMAGLETDRWVARKRIDLLEAIRSCAGLWIEAIASEAAVTPGGEIPVTVSVLSRSVAPVRLVSIEMPHGASLAPAPPDTADTRGFANRALETNRPVSGIARVRVPADAAITHPAWLLEEPEAGAYRMTDPRWITAAENPPALVARATLEIAGQRFAYEVPVLYRWTDRVLGERYRPLEIVPPVTVRLDRSAYLFPDASTRDVRVTVEASAAGATGPVRLELPPGWTATPSETTITVTAASPVGLRFRVKPSQSGGAASVTASMAVGGTRYARGRQVIDYSHIPVSTLFPSATAKLARVDLATGGSRVGYVMGSGDDVPDALEQMGYEVAMLTDEEIESGRLAGLDAIVVGVRAYNTRPALVRTQDRLLEYVKSGGTLVIQYSTTQPTLQDRLGPYPFQISRDRVTVEESPVQLTAGHPLLSRPNRIAASDFEGWVQERGLYFAKPWAKEYETPLAMGDPGESPTGGSLLYARHGKGTFIYTGLAWFRQLPAGVPGAYRLFANLVSGGKS